MSPTTSGDAVKSFWHLGINIYFLYVVSHGWQDMGNKRLFLNKANGGLCPGMMPEEQFWLLVDISPIHSEKVINALLDFMVRGYDRRAACEKHGVSQGYFSGAFDRFWNAHQTVNRLIPFYTSGNSISHTG